MSNKFHVNSNGEVGPCKAEIGCPFGGEGGFENHFETPEEATAFYENSMEDKLLGTSSAKQKSLDRKVSRAGLNKGYGTDSDLKNLIEFSSFSSKEVNDLSPKVYNDYMKRYEKSFNDLNEKFYKLKEDPTINSYTLDRLRSSKFAAMNDFGEKRKAWIESKLPEAYKNYENDFKDLDRLSSLNESKLSQEEYSKYLEEYKSKIDSIKTAREDIRGDFSKEHEGRALSTEHKYNELVYLSKKFEYDKKFSNKKRRQRYEELGKAAKFLMVSKDSEMYHRLKANHPNYPKAISKAISIYGK